MNKIELIEQEISKRLNKNFRFQKYIIHGVPTAKYRGLLNGDETQISLGEHLLPNSDESMKELIEMIVDVLKEV